MKKDLSQALDAVEMTYGELKETVADMINSCFAQLDEIVNNIGDINTLSNDQIRNHMAKLAIATYSLGEIKEKAVLKAQCAEALRKETYALKFSEAQGTIGAKETFAIIESAQETIAEALYDLISNLFKTKIDSAHRLIDALKSILMSRMSEAKLSTINLD